MEILKNITITIIFILLSCFVISAPQIYINIDPVFYEGDEIEFAFRMISYEDESIKYTSSVNCPDAPQALLELKQAKLKKDQPFYDSYSFGILDEDFEPGTCTASVSIKEPYTFTETRNFEIKTKPSFEYHITLSKKSITQNQELEINYKATVSSPVTTTTITTPDKKTWSLTLPTTVKLDEIGTYVIESTAEKKGYKTQTTKEQFAVIEKPAVIKSVSICNADNICNNKETSQNCPQDCKPEPKPEPVPKMSQVKKSSQARKITSLPVLDQQLEPELQQPTQIKTQVDELEPKKVFTKFLLLSGMFFMVTVVFLTMRAMR